MKPTIVIIDYEMGNIRSVHNSFIKMGARVKTSNSIKDITIQFTFFDYKQSLPILRKFHNL